MRLKYDENSTMTTSYSVSSLLTIHKGRTPTVIHKNESSSLLRENNDSFSEVTNDCSVHDCGFGDSFSKTNTDSSLNDSCFDDSNFDIN